MNIGNEFYKKKRAELLKSCQSEEVMIVTSSYPAWKTKDQFYPFKQDTNFTYLTGLSDQTPAALLLISDGFGGHQQWLLAPRPDEHKATWDGGVKSLDQLSQETGIEAVVCWDEFEKTFSKLFSSQKTVKLNIPELDFSPILHPAKTLKNKISSAFPYLQFLSVLPDIMNLRLIKESVEIDQIKKAIQITGKGIQAMKSAAKVCRNEFELETEFLYAIRKEGAAICGYEPIIASGKNATILHYRNNHANFSKQDVILTDVGAEWNGYTADITRVFSPSTFTDRQEKIINAVRHVNRQLISCIKVGMKYQELNDIAKELLTEKAMMLKLITTPTEIGTVYMHRVTHFLGLDVHDVGTYDQILKPGMLITIEPGLYSKEESLGVRIEDDVLVTENGPQILSESIEL